MSASGTTPLCRAAVLALTLALCASPWQRSAAHSLMTQPQSTSPRACRVGGQRQFAIGNCRGPCDLRAIRARPRRANFWSPAHPAATFARGQRVLIKYTRNNHAPGGFIRLALVPVHQLMDAAAHERNAFHYSCWGAHAVRARRSELRRKRFNFSMVGSDGKLHRFGKGYYVVRVTVPTVVPDGNYVLGWAWFGGTGGKLRFGFRAQHPRAMGYFGDYYSCAFVRVRGGPVSQQFWPRFVNDMSQFSKVGCMASADAPGICAREPCIRAAWFRRPRPFARGRRPPALTAAQFGAGGGGEGRFWRRVLGACRCLGRGKACSTRLVRDTDWQCRAWTASARQPPKCRAMCCDMCARLRAVRDACWAPNVRAVCGY